MCGARSQTSGEPRATTKWPLLQCGAGNTRPLPRGHCVLLRQGQLLLPALQACCLRHTFVLKVHAAPREELVGGRARHRVDDEREVARLRQRCLAAVAHNHCQVAANAVVVRCLKEQAPHVGLTWQLLIRDLFAGERLRREDNWCCVARHKATMTERSSSGWMRRAAPLVTWTRRGTEKHFTKNTIWPCSALGTRQETNSTPCRASSLPGVGAPGQLLSRGFRTTRPRTTHGAEH